MLKSKSSDTSHSPGSLLWFRNRLPSTREMLISKHKTSCHNQLLQRCCAPTQPMSSPFCFLFFVTFFYLESAARDPSSKCVPTVLENCIFRGIDLETDATVRAE